MKAIRSLLPLCLLAAGLSAQTVAIFPDEYIDVPEGPLNSPNYPLASGTSRIQIVYDVIDLQIPSGHQITKLGFRQDTAITTMDPGRITNIEIRMGYTTLASDGLTTTFDNNYAAPLVTVFGPANFTLPNLRDASNPLVDGMIWIPLTTPFTYVPAGRNLLVEYHCNGNSGGGGSWNYRLDRADYYSPIQYGPAGCPHSGGGTPNLTVQPTRPGLNYSCSMTSGPGNAPGFLLVQPTIPMTAPYALDVLLGVQSSCTGQVSPIGGAWLNAVASASGSASWNVFLANDPANADVIISSQAVFLDLFVPGGLVFSRGSEVLTGARPRSEVLRAAGPPALQTTGSISAFYCPVAFFEHQ